MRWFALILPLLASCSPGWGPMDAGKYVHIEPEAAPGYAIGTWTGGLGPYVMTMKIEGDGHVATCHSWNYRDGVGKAKMAASQLYFSDGSFAEVSQSEGGLIITPLGEVKHSSEFVRDESLKLAAPSCEEYFRQK